MQDIKPKTFVSHYFAGEMEVNDNGIEYAGKTQRSQLQ